MWTNNKFSRKHEPDKPLCGFPLFTFFQKWGLFPTLRTKQAILAAVWVGLAFGTLLLAGWKPLSGGLESWMAAPTVQYLPFIPRVDCIPRPMILPDDLERDLKVEARINEIRDERSLPRFSESQKITQAALRHSNDMADNNFFSHTGSDGTRAGDRLTDTCYRWQEYGEIIAAGYKTPASVVAAWMDSPGHRDIILDESLADFGAGYAYRASSRYKHYWTMDFGLLADWDRVSAGELRLCTYHEESEDGELWARLYTRSNCQAPFQEVRN